ncbi:zinc ribbon domain-containing protein [Metabacillus sediminilitoris]|uniref:zinc ribbon domain-containing protein n=1 Tax=Metabacillus sediminilitoris TaxID=2567941 RepID=UPI001D0D8553|nr:zinc ribbon domain-containing protein [Metabacillus sediminilitoris]
MTDHDGTFTMPNLTVVEMKNRVKVKIVELGIPKFIASLLTRNIHKLERWK